MKMRFGLAAVLLAIVVASAADAAQVSLAPIRNRSARPHYGHGQGALVIQNEDWVDYYVNVDRHRHIIQIALGNFGGERVPSATEIAIPLQSGPWVVVGNSDRQVEAPISDGNYTQLQLVPVGNVGQSGLIGIVEYQGRRRSDTLFNLGSVSGGVPVIGAGANPEPNAYPGIPVIGQTPPPPPYQQYPYQQDAGGQLGGSLADAIGSALDNFLHSHADPQPQQYYPQPYYQGY